MSLATRCPNCNTLFKVTSGQLQHHEGQVRCGNCKAVFSGIEHLTSPDTEAWQKLDFNQQNEPTDPGRDDLFSGQADSVLTKRSTAGQLLNFRHGSPAMKWACAALLLMLLAQAAWQVRLGALQHAPALASWINQAGPRVQKMFANSATRALRVDGSGLQALDENTLRVDLTLQNQQALPARWPHLKIDLLDPQGLVLASKTLAPSQYQVRNQGAASDSALIVGRSTVEVLAYLNIAKLNGQLPESAATGFRLELFDQGPGDTP
jgi:predicted Zn finger-like uncharacterized protein